MTVRRRGRIGRCATAAALFASLPVLVAAPGAQEAAVDPQLREAIGFYTGSSGTVDDRRARELLDLAAADGDPVSRMWVARCYSRGRMFYERDDARAREIAASVFSDIEALAADNVAEALFLVGTAYAEGLGVEPDEARAAAWFHRAADLDNILAQHNLGNAYAAGSGVPQDDRLAAYWYRQAAEQGDALTELWLGQFYEAGRGVAQSDAEAIRWYERSAGRGNARAGEALARLRGR